ncbi:hypothetical protein [Singulisphaera acidiphila]|uniref:hypothetical protein n=1 Tax=Singulisphaera acidiphila TaxID=466153 RepID=UPI0005C65C8E|nr:hypothetical protein [Singulisphaera acidiphila]
MCIAEDRPGASVELLDLNRPARQGLAGLHLLERAEPAGAGIGELVDRPAPVVVVVVAGDSVAGDEVVGDPPLEVPVARDGLCVPAQPVEHLVVARLEPGLDHHPTPAGL